MKKLVVATWLPIFDGFYSNLVWDSYIESDIENYDVDAELDIDYNGFYEELSRGIADAVAVKMKDSGVLGVKFEKLVRPRYYNYDNDAINCELTIDVDYIRDYIYDNKEAFTQYIEDNYKSYDGFASFYPDTFEGWEEQTNGFSFVNEDEERFIGHAVGSVLNFIAKEDEITEDDLAEWTSNNCSAYIGEYVKEMI